MEFSWLNEFNYAFVAQFTLSEAKGTLLRSGILLSLSKYQLFREP